MTILDIVRIIGILFVVAFPLSMAHAAHNHAEAQRLTTLECFGRGLWAFIVIMYIYFSVWVLTYD